MGVDTERSPALRRAGLILSILVAATGAVLHVASFFFDIDGTPAIIAVLALASLACFGAMLAASRFGRASMQLSPIGRAFGEAMGMDRSEKGAVFRKIPPLAIAGAVAGFLYVAINFLLFILNTSEGHPVSQNGQFLLMNGSTVVRLLDTDEFRHLETLQFRGMSGHFILFAGVAALGFAYLADPREQPGLAEADQGAAGGGAGEV